MFDVLTFVKPCPAKNRFRAHFQPVFLSKTRFSAGLEDKPGFSLILNLQPVLLQHLGVKLGFLVHTPHAFLIEMNDPPPISFKHDKILLLSTCQNSVSSSDFPKNYCLSFTAKMSSGGECGL
jgi:hypothetical protein